VEAVAAGRLPDGTPVIVSGGDDGTVRVWRLADGSPLVPALELPESMRAVAVHGDTIVTVAGADIAIHQPALLRRMSSFREQEGTNRSDNGRLSGTTRSPASNHVGGTSAIRRARPVMKEMVLVWEGVDQTARPNCWPT
jgi:WD40 repeat protein